MDAIAAGEQTEFTHADLVSRRKRGYPRPESVSQDDWDAATPPPQATRLEQDLETALLNSIHAGDKSVFGLLFPEAIRQLASILTDPGEATKYKLQAIAMISDQHAGKPTQEIQHTGNISLEIRKHAAELEARYRDVSATSAPALASPPSPIDSFLEANGASGYVVGKRGADEQGPEQEPGEGLCPGDGQGSESAQNASREEAI